jgi:hypothetical protein
VRNEVGDPLSIKTVIEPNRKHCIYQTFYGNNPGKYQIVSMVAITKLSTAPSNKTLFTAPLCHAGDES